MRAVAHTHDSIRLPTSVGRSTVLHPLRSPPPVRHRPRRYSKKDVVELKSVFDGYDEDRSGKISLKEFSASLNKNKKKVGVGVKSTREERKAAEGISLAGGAPPTQPLVASACSLVALPTTPWPRTQERPSERERAVRRCAQILASRSSRRWTLMDPVRSPLARCATPTHADAPTLRNAPTVTPTPPLQHAAPSVSFVRRLSVVHVISLPHARSFARTTPPARRG